MSIPGLLTKRLNFFTCFAVQSGFVQCKVFVPLCSLILISVLAWHTGQNSGIVKVPSFFFTPIHFGIILFALIISSVVFPSSPIPRRSISLILQREARLTVVPSSATGSNTATGEMVDAAQDHSTYFNVVSARHLPFKRITGS